MTFRTTTKLLFSTFNDVHNHGSVQIYNLYLQAAQDCQHINAVKKTKNGSLKYSFKEFGFQYIVLATIVYEIVYVTDFLILFFSSIGNEGRMTQ